MIALVFRTLVYQYPLKLHAARQRERYIKRLKKKSADHHTIQQATLILLRNRALDESDAYQLLRSQAMLKRESIESIAAQIVKAQAALSF